MDIIPLLFTLKYFNIKLFKIVCEATREYTEKIFYVSFLARKFWLDQKRILKVFIFSLCRALITYLY